MTATTTPQRKIDSGFGARTTAAEVLRGIDLTGTLALVTGGYSGLGLETTRALVGAGARVLVAGRRPEEARRVLGGLDRVEIAELDLADLDSVARFADTFLASGRALPLVINNAGIMAAPETRVGPGWEAQFATNHLGHFALVNRIWPAIARAGGARVVSVSSVGHHHSPIRWHDPHFAEGYDKWKAYGQAKTANVLFAGWLDRLGRASGVRAFSLHPGGILTPLQRHMELAEMVEYGWVDAEGNALNPDFKSPEQGAATQVWAATSPALDGLGGAYCEDCDIADAEQVREYALDPEQAERLWSLSAELTGVNAFAAR
ncbi:NAD(P)-dependent dehydrogenase, short-chain alcohol dehydrogenase family [Streptomyces zhaozhouensis]|uniref:Probable oxidoreductase n=1 Tax=Streptomyces zhaozhouensis TaxID=1300267 RepID=A0A286E1G2_9ACTN|nr:SDR family NAD(P)-dependent oxidoreductase [Streptomyces zhaozhouensis]SOD64731.1 NAD(P)-dependent dehydrogenase, short-chain alcohol dehydrogenase family [Streptomyces zhaozhouensis]